MSGPRFCWSVAILVFLWTLHTDISDLAQRVSRIEGLLEDISDLAQRVSRIEGLLEGYVGRQSAGPITPQ